MKSSASKKEEQFTTDVTAAVKAIAKGTQKFIVFQWTGNAEGGLLAGKASSAAPVLTITTASADEMTTYTVKFVDGESKELKTAAVYDALIGDKVSASATDMANFYTDDNTKKYIYVSGNTEIEAAKESTSNVITLKFREAATYKYTVKAVDAEGKTLNDI